MIQVRKSEDRGYANHGWLKTHHSFSFADYYDSNFMGFRDLRVINEDFIESGMGFGTHGHRDMEIITYVLEGILQHKDSMGNTAHIHPDEVQHMSAGTGVQHSEFNPREDMSVHLLQIWILPEKEGVKPGYGQKSFKSALNERSFVLVASKTGVSDSISINQDVNVYVGKSKKDETIHFKTQVGRGVWVQVVRGDLKINGTALKTGDGAAVESEPELNIAASAGAEFLLFDLP